MWLFFLKLLVHGEIDIEPHIDYFRFNFGVFLLTKIITSQHCSDMWVGIKKFKKDRTPSMQGTRHYDCNTMEVIFQCTVDHPEVESPKSIVPTHIHTSFTVGAHRPMMAML